jgi:osmotically-inducible protein OsmY
MMSGCAAVGVAGAAGGAVLGLQDRTIGRGIDDAATSSAIKTRLMAYDSAAYSRVDVEVAEGQVLLSGTTGSDQNRMDAERIAWGVGGVESVANQIAVGRNRGIMGSTHDNWITARVRAKIVADKAIKGLNINIETQDGVVYLMGLVRSEDELRRAAEAASYVGGVRKVVSYMVVRPQTPADMARANTGAAPIELSGPPSQSVSYQGSASSPY